MNVEELLARTQIMEVLWRYCRAVDRGDVELLRSIYHDGGTDAHGSFVGTGVDFAPYIVDKMDAATIVGQHHITNALIELHGDTAAVESYFLAIQPYVSAEGTNLLGFIGGRYLDRFACLDGAWGVTERRVIMDWSRASLDGAEWPGMPGYPLGARHEVDPSTGFFSNIR
ncbi:nuclear transport factor 2 family protein [soil metagenome]